MVDEEAKKFGAIVDTVVEAGSFKMFVAAVKAAGLVDILNCEGHSPFLRAARRNELVLQK